VSQRGGWRGRLQPAALGALALSGSNVIRMVVQLAMLPVLARLVGPAEYGLVALAVPFVLFCNMLADAGMSQALARRQDATPELESTVFWLAAGLGLALAVAASLGAWPLGWALRQPRLPGLIMALSPILVMSGATAVANARVIRQGRFAVFAGGDLISTVAAAAVAFWAAYHGAGAWSLVAQQITLWLAKFLWVNAAARPPVAAGFRPSEVRDLARFGLHAVGSNLSDFVARNVDNMIVGGVLGATALGYYAMAYQIVRVPDLILSGPLYLYIFTAVSRAAHRGDRAQAAQLAVSALRLTVTALAPVFAGLALVAPLAVHLVLGEKWRPAGPVLAYLCAAGFAFANGMVTGAVLMALGRSHLQFRLAMLGGAATILAVGLFAPFGLDVAAQALGVGILLAAGVALAVLARDLAIPARRIAAAFAPGLVGAAVMSLALAALGPRLAGLPEAAQLALLVAAGGTLYAAVVLVFARRRLAADVAAFAHAHGGGLTDLSEASPVPLAEVAA